MISDTLQEYEEISIVFGFLFLLFAAPLLHETFHQAVLWAMNCEYREQVHLTIPVSAETEPLCDMTKLQNAVFLSAGVVFSVITAELIYLLSLKSIKVFSLPLSALSSSILISNGLMLFQRTNDLTLLGISGEVSFSAGSLLIIIAILQMIPVLNKKSDDWNNPGLP